MVLGVFDILDLRHAQNVYAVLMQLSKQCTLHKLHLIHLYNAAPTCSWACPLGHRVDGDPCGTCYIFGVEGLVEAQIYS